MENCICDCLLSIRDDVFLLLAGDLNSRVSNFSSCLHENVMSVYDDLYKSGSLNVGRNSEDTVLNSYGKLLLNACTALDMCMVNGMCEGDLQGRYTYISDSGSSVNDYFLMSRDLFFMLSDICKLHVREKIDSDHMPLELYVIFFPQWHEFQ